MANFWDKVRSWMEGEEPGDEAPEVPGPPVSRDDFAGLLLDAAGQLGVDQLAYDADDFCLRGAEGTVSWLHNRYDEYLRSSASDQPRLLTAWAAQLVPHAGEISLDWQIAAPRLRPRIRSRFFLESVGLSLQLEGRSRTQVPWIPLGDDLVVTPVYDLPTMMSSLGQEHLDAWGVDLDRVMQVALDNLRDDEEPVAVASLGDGLRIVHVGDDYDSSRLLLTELLAELKLPPSIVALPATRAHLFLATTSDPDAMGMLLELARRVREEPRLETLQPVVFRGGSWHNWEPPPELPDHADWRELILWGRACDYQQQADLLRTWLGRSGIDLDVAAFHVVDDDEGPLSATTWDLCPALLPEAEQVVVVAPTGDQAVDVAWSVLRSLAGRELRRDHERWPPRWRVQGPVSDSLWAALVAEHPPQPYPPPEGDDGDAQ